MSAPLPVAGTAVVLRDGPRGLETLLLRRPETGSFAGAWVFPGGKVEDVDVVPGETETDAARRAAVREAQEETGMRVADAAVLSHWTPPPQTPVRISTWFFLARDLGDELHLSAGEIVDAVWLTPEQAFDGHVDGSLTLFPPTWVTLHGLRGHRTVDEAYASLGDPEHFATQVTPVKDGMLITWQGDEEHPGGPGVFGARHRLTTGVLPWRYERT
ncbi:NUDIX domain-containing protein [Microbacterium sp. NPDC058345]|uniref:NUDIX domain-containing protein n=1 Tax=Microbacterium sp. NPDC058345 TaxID=3346455 RepID=UPI00365FD4D3